MCVLLQRAARLVQGRRNLSLPEAGQEISYWGDREGRTEGTGGADQ